MLHIDPTLLPAVFGLIGVIVGGLITAGVDYFLEERRAYRDETKERRKRLTDLKQAARLVHEDFVWASASVDIAIESKRWISLSVDPVRLETSREYRRVLATETTFGDWAALKAAVRSMEWCLRLSTEAKTRNERDINDSNLRSLETQKETLRKGRAALKPY